MATEILLFDFELLIGVRSVVFGIAFLLHLDQRPLESMSAILRAQDTHEGYSARFCGGRKKNMAFLKNLPKKLSTFRGSHTPCSIGSILFGVVFMSLWLNSLVGAAL